MRLQILLSWLGQPKGAYPDDWSDFLDIFVVTFCLVVALTVLMTVVFYAISARQKRIHFPADVFAAYTPMLWLLLSVVGGLVVALLFNHFASAQDYIRPDAPPVLGSDANDARTVYAIYLFAYSGALCAALSWVLITAVPWFTPREFKYRPAPFLHERKARAR